VTDDKLAITLLTDRVLVKVPSTDADRLSKGGLLIPATAQMAKRLAWAEVVAVGPQVRSIQAHDRVLFNPEDRYEVDVSGEDYLLLRERDIHGVAADRIDGSTGLYL
jgi:chaperonin GroES